MPRLKKTDPQRCSSNRGTEININGQRVIMKKYFYARKSTAKSSITQSQDFNRRGFGRLERSVLADIRHYQKTRKNLISRAPFQRLVREIAQGFNESIQHFEVAALEALQVRR